MMSRDFFLTVVRGRTIFPGMKDKSPRGIIDQIPKIREPANLFIERVLNPRGIEGVVSAHGMVLRIYFSSRARCR
jgi:hypothetical protein